MTGVCVTHRGSEPRKLFSACQTLFDEQLTFSEAFQRLHIYSIALVYLQCMVIQSSTLNQFKPEMPFQLSTSGCSSDTRALEASAVTCDCDCCTVTVTEFEPNCSQIAVKLGTKSRGPRGAEAWMFHHNWNLTRKGSLRASADEKIRE